MDHLHYESDEAACAICGCTEERACPGGCWWIEDPAGLMRDICSACEDAARRQLWYPGMPVK